jgi:hypothetical protein
MRHASIGLRPTSTFAERRKTAVREPAQRRCQRYLADVIEPVTHAERPGVGEQFEGAMLSR